MIDLERVERVWLKRVALSAGLLAAASIVAYFAWFAVLRRSLADTTEGWGQFGDYVGGFAGTILAGATVALLVMSVLIQLQTYQTTREELKATSQALADQLKQSRHRAALDSFQATLILFLSQRVYLQQRNSHTSLPNALSAFREHVDRGSYVQWSSAHSALLIEFQSRAAFLSPMVKLLNRLGAIAIDEARDASLLETLGACLDDDELRSVRLLAHFNVPDTRLAGVVASASAFALLDSSAENELSTKLQRYPKPT